MGYKDLLVHIDNSKYCASRVGTAIELARQNDARLTGIYVNFTPHFKSLAKDGGEEGKKAEAHFRSQAEAAGIRHAWITDRTVAGNTVTDVVSRHAQCKDIVIVGQADHGDSDRNIPHDLPERLVLGCGRPVLIVPYTGKVHKLGKNIMMGWKAERESTRALNDAMPFFQDAQTVNILTVNPRSEGDPDGIHYTDEISDHLACHGIEAKVEHVFSKEIGVADTLLNRVSDEGIDLLVMGAYAHTRRGTLTLGKVGRHILRHMTIPVLMSH